MPKVKKSNLQWESDFRAYAVKPGMTMNQGCNPGKNSKEAAIIKKIQECPLKKGVSRGRGLSGFIVGARVITCACGWHPCHPCYKPAGDPAAPARASGVPAAGTGDPDPNPDKGMCDVGWEFPKKPDRPKQKEIEGKSEWIYRKGHMDVCAFGPTTGCCYKSDCRSKNVEAKDRCSHLKFVWNNGWPCYAIGVDIECQTCGTTIKSIDSKCVQTLPMKDRLTIPFIQTGAAYGVAFNLIKLMRLGHYAGSVWQAAEALVHVKCQALKSAYESKAQGFVDRTSYSLHHPFQELPRGYIPKGNSLMQAFTLDYKVNKNNLLREIMTFKSVQAFAMDHQAQVMKRVGRRDVPTKEGEDGKQTGILNGDYGLVHNLVVVPDNGEEWMNDALDELCLRHGDACPKILFVDCNCCSDALEENGPKPPPAKGEEGHSYWKDMLKKKLDGFHSAMRMSRAGNAAHPRHQKAAQQCCKAIYIKDKTCHNQLEQVRLHHEMHSLTDADKVADWKKYGRNTPGPGALVAQRLIAVLRHHRQLDAETRAHYRNQGFDLAELDQDNTHPAFPIVTKAFASAVTQQAIHSLNGCMDCNGSLAHVKGGESNYRNTGTMLPVHSSPFGTSLCETFHSVTARHFYSLTGIRTVYYDARSLWKAIHFNRNKLRKLNHDMPPNGVAPNEYSNARLINPGLGDDKPPMLWEFDYCRHVVAKQNRTNGEDALKAMELGNPDPEINVVELESDERHADDDDTAAIVADVEDEDFTRGWLDEQPTDEQLDKTAAQTLVNEELRGMKNNPPSRSPRRRRTPSSNSTPTATANPNAATTTQTENTPILEPAQVSFKNTPSPNTNASTETPRRSQRRKPSVYRRLALEENNAQTESTVTPPSASTNGDFDGMFDGINDDDIPDELFDVQNEGTTQETTVQTRAPQRTPQAAQRSPWRRSPQRSPQCPLGHLDSVQPVPTENELMAVIENRITTDKRNRNAGRRKALRGELNYVPPAFNEDMKLVWQELYAEAASNRAAFNSGSIDQVFIKELHQKYTIREIEEREKGPSGKKLLPVRRQQCAAWLKQFTKERNDNIRLNRWSQESAEMDDNIESYLMNSNVASNPVIEHQNLQTIDAKARPLKDADVNQRPIKKRRGQQHCRTCGMPIGNGPGEHGKFECPKKVTLTKEETATKKLQALEQREKKARRDKEKGARILVAQANIQLNSSEFQCLSQEIPDRASKNQRECPICGFVVKKVPMESPDWHFIKSNAALYCPWADDKKVKVKIQEEQNLARIQRNKKR